MVLMSAPDDPLAVILDPTPGLDLLGNAHKLRRTKEGRAILAASGRGAGNALYEARDRGARPPSKWDARHFVGWDGEGITDNQGRHRYVILGNSYGNCIVDPRGIDTKAALTFMLEQAQLDKLATHVIFAGGYDVNMILKGKGRDDGFRQNHARVLSDQGHVTIRLGETRYRIEYHPRHTFDVREEVWNETKNKCDKIRSFRLWDVFGSYQASFVKACQRTLPDEALADLDLIIAMKGKRGLFTVDDIPEMTDYMFAELKALVILCERDAESFEAAGFKATRYDGAGAKASAVLHAKGVGAHMTPTGTDLSVPTRGAYAGGRIEVVRFGQHDGPMFTVDIRSAYPWAATMLPSLSHGWWERVTNPGDGPDESDEFSVWLINYKGAIADTLHPLFWRSEDGRICYPQHTEGWYWAPEVWQAVHNSDGHCKVLEGWRYHPESDARPFDFIPALFDARKRLEATTKGRGWPLKLALNSLYGKTAQQIGAKDGKPPRWHQLEWAGWITSKVRATMFSLATPRLSDLVSIETDGLTFRGHPDDRLRALAGTQLGDLEIAQYDAGMFVQSGIYWLHQLPDDIRIPSSGWLDPKVRGVGAGVLTRDAFLREWDAKNFGDVIVEVTRFRGMVTSGLTADRWQDWCQWVTEPRNLLSCPQGKRIHQPSACPTCLSGSSGLHQTLPTGGGRRSSLHTLSFETTLGRTTTDEWWLDTLDMEDSE